jgi:hypothetical protein
VLLPPPPPPVPAGAEASGGEHPAIGKVNSAAMVKANRQVENFISSDSWFRKNRPF